MELRESTSDIPEALISNCNLYNTDHKSGTDVENKHDLNLYRDAGMIKANILP